MLVGLMSLVLSSLFTINASIIPVCGYLGSSNGNLLAYNMSRGVISLSAKCFNGVKAAVRRFTIISDWTD